MTDIDLSTVPLSALTAEIKRRMTEFTEAQRMMSGFIPGIPAASVAVTRRAKHVPNNPMKKAAEERWAGWKEFARTHPGATTKEYFKARRKEKA